MQRISVHVSNETKRKLDLVAKFENKIESELLREAIDAGLDLIFPKFNSAKHLVDLARMAKKLKSQPKELADISSDTAKYAFGNQK